MQLQEALDWRQASALWPSNGLFARRSDLTSTTPTITSLLSLEIKFQLKRMKDRRGDICMPRQIGLRTAHFGDTVLLVPTKIAKKGPKIAKKLNFGDFWPFFGDFLSVLATLCRRSEPSAVRFAWPWSCYELSRDSRLDCPFI